MRGLIVNLYESKSHGNCSNHGMSSRCKIATLVGKGIDEVFEVSDDAPAVHIVERSIYGKPYLTAYPIESCPSNKTGYSFGGVFIFSSDSRFPADYPIPLHDRTE